MKFLKNIINIKTLSLLGLLTFCIVNLQAQEERKIIREGNKLYKNKDYENAELNYKKALEINPELEKLHGNVSASQYRSGKFNDAVSSYQNVLKLLGNDKDKADAFYNIGNSYLQAGEYDKSIQAYKNAIRLNPEHDQSRYNMAVATKIRQQQNSGGDGQNQDQNQDKQNDQNKDNKDNKDNQDKQDKQDDSKQDEKQDQNKDKEKQNQQQDNQMSREEMERYLEALQQQEKDVQDKVNKEKFKTQKRVIEKNW